MTPHPSSVTTPSATIAAGEGGQAIHTRVRGVTERLLLGPGRHSVDRGLDDLRHVVGVGDHRDVVRCDLDGGRAHALGKLSLGIGWNRLVAVGDTIGDQRRLRPRRAVRAGGAMTDERERDGWTRHRPMSKQEKLALIREMNDRLRAGEKQENKARAN
jgi:hypothetical protein